MDQREQDAAMVSSLAWFHEGAEIAYTPYVKQPINWEKDAKQIEPVVIPLPGARLGAYLPHREGYQVLQHVQGPTQAEGLYQLVEKINPAKCCDYPWNDLQITPLLPEADPFCYQLLTPRIYTMHEEDCIDAINDCALFRRQHRLEYIGYLHEEWGKMTAILTLAEGVYYVKTDGPISSGLMIDTTWYDDVKVDPLLTLNYAHSVLHDDEDYWCYPWPSPEVVHYHPEWVQAITLFEQVEQVLTARPV